VDLKDLSAYLKSLQGDAAKAAAPAATAMANGFQDRLSNVTLKKSGHAPYTFYRAVRGEPPAYATGRLARSFKVSPAHGDIRASASVGSNLRYAAIQEWGGWTEPRRALFMHWRNPRAWYFKHVDIPAHPYMRPTVDDMFHDGTFSRLASKAFEQQINKYFKS
jgi:phage gpG-like protein